MACLRRPAQFWEFRSESLTSHLNRMCTRTVGLKRRHRTKNLRLATSFQMSRRSCILRHHVLIAPAISRINNDIWHGSHRVRRNGARPFFLTDQLKSGPYETPVLRIATIFYGGCGAFYFFIIILRCGAVRCGSLKPHRTARKNRTVNSLQNNPRALP